MQRKESGSTRRCTLAWGPESLPPATLNSLSWRICYTAREGELNANLNANLRCFQYMSAGIRLLQRCFLIEKI